MRRHDPMPERFNVLAGYNSEVAHGIVHTPEWDAQMAALQSAFNEWVQTRV